MVDARAGSPRCCCKSFLTQIKPDDRAAALVCSRRRYPGGSLTMTTCPICGAEAEELPRTGGFHGIRCQKHDEFEVSDTTMSIGRGKASPSHWERALKRAKLRTESGKRPRIMDEDFF